MLFGLNPNGNHDFLIGLTACTMKIVWSIFSPANMHFYLASILLLTAYWKIWKCMMFQSMGLGMQQSTLISMESGTAHSSNQVVGHFLLGSLTLWLLPSFNAVNTLADTISMPLDEFMAALDSNLPGEQLQMHFDEFVTALDSNLPDEQAQVVWLLYLLSDCTTWMTV